MDLSKFVEEIADNLGIDSSAVFGSTEAAAEYTKEAELAKVDIQAAVMAKQQEIQQSMQSQQAP